MIIKKERVKRGEPGNVICRTNNNLLLVEEARFPIILEGVEPGGGGGIEFLIEKAPTNQSPDEWSTSGEFENCGNPGGGRIKFAREKNY